MSDHPRRFYEFDPFLLDAQERLLFLDGRPLDLTPKVFDILLELVRHSGRVVEKKELMERVWPDSYVEDSNLTQHVSTLRKKLAQSTDKQRYILTVPGRGYRFVASVKGWDDDALVTVHERIRTRIIEDEGGGADVGFGLVKRADAGALTDEPHLKSVVHAAPARPRVLPAAPPRWFKQYRWPLAALGLVLVAAILFGAYDLWLRPAAAPFAGARLSKFTTNGKTTCAAISPDGKYVAYTLAEAGLESLWLKQVATSNGGLQILAPADFHYSRLAFTPDGSYLYFLRGERNSPSALYRVPALGGAPAVRLVEDADSAPAFSPDGRRMAYVRGYPDTQETSLIIAGADGTDARKLATLKWPQARFNLPAGPSWSPDGKSIACAVTMIDEAGESEALFTAAVEGGALLRVTQERWLQVGRAAWLENGRGLVMIAADQETTLAQVWYVSYPAGEAQRVTNDLAEYRDLSLTADSKMLAVIRSERQANIWLVPGADGGRASQITSGNYDGIDGLAWTAPDHLIYTTWSNGAQNLTSADESGGQQIQLTVSGGSNKEVAVSPDGSQIVFASTRDGKQHLWKMNADGSGLQKLTDGVRDGGPVFSPDGRWIVYRSYRLGNPNLFKIPSGGGAPQRLTDRISGAPSISPDGKMIACTYREEALSKIKLALVPLDEGAPLRTFELQEVPARLMYRWMTDGRSLAFIHTSGGVSDIWLQPLDGGAPSRLTDFQSELIFNFAVSRDGRRLLVARGHIANDAVLINIVK